LQITPASFCFSLYGLSTSLEGAWVSFCLGGCFPPPLQTVLDCRRAFTTVFFPFASLLSFSKFPPFLLLTDPRFPFSFPPGKTRFPFLRPTAFYSLFRPFELVSGGSRSIEGPSLPPSFFPPWLVNGLKKGPGAKTRPEFPPFSPFEGPPRPFHPPFRPPSKPKARIFS